MNYYFVFETVVFFYFMYVYASSNIGSFFWTFEKLLANMCACMCVVIVWNFSVLVSDSPVILIEGMSNAWHVSHIELCKKNQIIIVVDMSVSMYVCVWLHCCVCMCIVPLWYFAMYTFWFWHKLFCVCMCIVPFLINLYWIWDIPCLF